MDEKTSRKEFLQYCVDIVHAVSARSTCRHRDCGAIIIRDKHIISTGYNGAPSGAKDCIELGFCTKNDRHEQCLASGVHAEANAILSAARFGISTDGATMFARYSPCRTCAAMVKAAGIIEFYYEEEYSSEPSGVDFLKSLGVKVHKIVL